MKTIFWTLAFLLGVGLFLAQLIWRFRLLLAASKDDGRDYSPKTYARRFQDAVVYGLAQKKFFIGEQPAGWMHVAVFWGFCVLLFQVVTMFLRGWVAEFQLPVLTGELLRGPYALTKDLFEVIVMAAVLVALFRWLVTKPKRLFGILPAEAQLHSKSHLEAVLILLFIFTIMLSGLFYDAAESALSIVVPPVIASFDPFNEPISRMWQPVSGWLAGFLGSVDQARAASSVSWWIHNLVILVFINLLPRSKHFHILTAIANIFLGKMEPKGKLPKRDFSGDNPSFGRSQANHFTWKQILDMFSCTECGRCSQVCPATATGKPLAPRQLLLNLRDHVYTRQPRLTGSQETTQHEVVVVGDGKAVADDVIWSCVACRACEEACPVNIEYVDKIIDIRQHLVQEVSRFPEELNRVFKGLETQSNPWGISSSERGAWAQGLDVPLVSEKKDFEYLYYVGCGGAYDSNNRRATQALAALLKKGGVCFAILGNDELCNGETARRLGNEYLFQTMAEALVNRLNDSGAKKILVNCPHCFNTLTNEYPDFGGRWQVEHAAEVISRLIAEGKLKLDRKLQKTVAYHDSCYYGRFNGIFEKPRSLLRKIGGLNLKEMASCKQQSTCCGGGGGRMWMEEPKDQRVNVMRTEQAIEKKPDIVCTSCPYCRIMIGSGVNEKGLSESVRVADVMEVIHEQCT